MNTNRLGPGPTIAAVAAVVLLAVMFFGWFNLEGVSSGDGAAQFGVFLGLIAAAAIAYGGWRSMQEEGTTFGQQADRLQDRMGSDDEPPPPPPAAPPSGGTGAPPPGPTV